MTMNRTLSHPDELTPRQNECRKRFPGNGGRRKMPEFDPKYAVRKRVTRWLLFTWIRRMKMSLKWTNNVSQRSRRTENSYTVIRLVPSGQMCEQWIADTEGEFQKKNIEMRNEAFLCEVCVYERTNKSTWTYWWARNRLAWHRQQKTKDDKKMKESMKKEFREKGRDERETMLLRSIFVSVFGCYMYVSYVLREGSKEQERREEW